MKHYVVDASVVAAAFFREEYADRARSLLTGTGRMFAPDLVYAELANVIWKRHGRKEIDGDEAGQLLDDVLGLLLRIFPSEGLIQPALHLALRTGRTVYDCLYLALAVMTKSVMVTCDQRLVNALAGSPLQKHTAWIGHDQ